MTVHHVKSWPEYFAAIKSGDKPFDLRPNDRDYQAGDTSILQEWLPDQREYTGERIERRITYVLIGSDTGWSQGEIPKRGLRAGFAILGLGRSAA